MENSKKQFLRNEILNNVIRAGFQRANIYKTEISDKEKEEFRKYVKSLVEDFSQEYLKEKISYNKHLENINKLQDKISEKINISFGIAQKLLNLYLKYLWCEEELKNEPPNCPVDFIVLSQVGLGNIRWTKMTRKEYEEAIKKITEYSLEKGFSITSWELNFFNGKNPSYGGYK